MKSLVSMQGDTMVEEIYVLKRARARMMRYEYEINKEQSTSETYQW